MAVLWAVPAGIALKWTLTEGPKPVRGFERVERGEHFRKAGTNSLAAVSKRTATVIITARGRWTMSLWPRIGRVRGSDRRAVRRSERDPRAKLDVSRAVALRVVDEAESAVVLRGYGRG